MFTLLPNETDVMRDLRMLEYDALERVRALEEQCARAVRTLRDIQAEIRNAKDMNLD